MLQEDMFENASVVDWFIAITLVVIGIPVAMLVLLFGRSSHKEEESTPS